MNYFLVTSAVNTNYGVFSFEERIEQIINSAKSIRKKINDAYIILVDGGSHPLTIFQRRTLLKEYDDILDFSSDITIQQIHKYAHGNHLLIKGPSEQFILKEACKLLSCDETDRIFKLSGRYQLSKNFNLENHNHLGKFVFKQRNEGILMFDPDTNKTFPYSEYQYQTRLYSFCGSLIEPAIDLYEKLFNTFIFLFENGSFSIVEDAIFQLLDKSICYEINTIGVTGYQRYDNIFIDE